MHRIDPPLDLDQSRNPWFSLISLFLLVLGGTIIFGFALSMILLLPLGITDVEGLLQNVHPDMEPKMKVGLLIFQGSFSAGGFILAPLVFLWLIARIKPMAFFQRNGFDGKIAVPAFVMVILFMIIDAPIIEWNSNVELPEQLEEYESWAMEKETELAELTQILTTFNSFGEFLLGMLIIAVIPAIGEEFLFRGLIQNYLLKISTSHHIAIWTAAIVFGAFHLQFYGVVPRILLGALFGYLYVWSGSIWTAVWAHFVNNGFTLLMSYIYQRGGVDFNIQDATAPSFLAVLPALVFFAGLVYFFRKAYFLKT